MAPAWNMSYLKTYLTESSRRDDASVDWSGFDLAVLRSTWDYSQRLAEFLAWAARAAQKTQLLNPLPVLRWNTDKHYLSHLIEAGVPTVPSSFIEPGETAARLLDAFIAAYAPQSAANEA